MPDTMQVPPGWAEVVADEAAEGVVVAATEAAVAVAEKQGQFSPTVPLT